MTPRQAWQARRNAWAREWEAANPRPKRSEREAFIAWSKAREEAARIRDADDPRPEPTETEAHAERTLRGVHSRLLIQEDR